MKNRLVNKILGKECYHLWKPTGYCWCQACGDFFKAKKMKMGWHTHGTIVSQCLRCGLLIEKEYGYFNTEEMQNLEFEEIEIPHIKGVKPRGLK